MADTLVTTMSPALLFNNIINNCERNLQNYAFFKKCGEITVSADKKYFGLNCAFCNETYLQLYVFIQHISEEHGKDIDRIYSNETDKQLSLDNWNVSHCISANSSCSSSNGSLNQTNAEIVSMTAPTTATAIPTATTTTTATTNTMTTLATLLSEVDFDFFEKTEEAAELQELVYIMEDNSTNDLNVVEEGTVEAFRALDSNASTTAIDEKKGCDSFKNSLKEVQLNERSNAIRPNVAEQVNEPVMSEQLKQTLETQAAELQFTASKNPIEEAKTATATTRRAGHNREVISFLLEAYKNNAKLWDPNHPKYKYNAPRKIFNELSEPLAKELNVKLSGVEIFNTIIGLRSRYRRELTKMQAHDNKRQSNLWYYEKMHFLRDIIENRRADRKSKIRQKQIADSSVFSSIDNTANLTNKAQTPAQLARTKGKLNFLLKAFKQHEILWNTEHADFTKCDKLKIFEDISAQLFKEQNMKITASACKMEVDKLISRYRKELNALNRRKGLHVPKLWCFEQMDFMRPIFENELIKRKRRKKGIVAPKPRTRQVEANTIAFINNDEQLKFIEIYEKYPALWSCEHPDYRSTKYRDAAMKDMLSNCNAAFNMEATVEQLDKTIATLRKSYSQQKLKTITLSDEDTSEGIINNSATTSPNGMATEIFTKLKLFLDGNVGPFRCDICQMIIRTSDQYKIHKSAHEGTPPFLCPLCKKGFQVPGNLAIHIRRHKRDFPYSCEQCNKSFATSTEVAIHQRVHTGDRPYICDLCGKTFKTWSFFDIHRRVHLNQSTFLCPICDKGFYEKNRYTAHMNGHLNIRKHSCTTCGKSFTTLANLQKHNELHLPVRKYKCETCGMRFKQFASLRWHKRKTHSIAGACDDDSMEQ